MHVASMYLWPTESNRYGTTHHLVSGSTWKQTKIQQTMLHVAYTHTIRLNLNIGGMAQNFFGNHLTTRAFRDGTDPTEILPDDPEVKISAIATQSQECFSL